MTAATPRDGLLTHEKALRPPDVPFEDRNADHPRIGRH